MPLTVPSSNVLSYSRWYSGQIGEWMGDLTGGEGLDLDTRQEKFDM